MSKYTCGVQDRISCYEEGKAPMLWPSLDKIRYGIRAYHNNYIDIYQTQYSLNGRDGQVVSGQI